MFYILSGVIFYSIVGWQGKLRVNSRPSEPPNFVGREGRLDIQRPRHLRRRFNEQYGNIMDLITKLKHKGKPID